MLKRQIILDTETTGLSANNGDRLLEFAGIEMVDRRLTGKSLHLYIHPDRDIPVEASRVHGLYMKDLADKPKFAQVGQEIADFLAGSELIIHNASFDIGFLNMEFQLMGLPKVDTMIDSVIDTVAMARQLYPGQKVNLDALCNRLGVDKSKRVTHGALIDCELLAEVYLGMTRGQFTLGMNVEDDQDSKGALLHAFQRSAGQNFKVIAANAEEMAEHAAYVSALDQSSGADSVYRQQQNAMNQPKEHV